MKNNSKPNLIDKSSGPALGLATTIMGFASFGLVQMALEDPEVWWMAVPFIALTLSGMKSLANGG